MILGHDFHILLFLILLLLLFRWCCCFWFCYFNIILFFFLLILLLLPLLSFIKFVLIFCGYFRYFFAKSLGSPIIYVRDICLPVYVTFCFVLFWFFFHYFFALDTAFLPINSLTYKISL